MKQLQNVLLNALLKLIKNSDTIQDKMTQDLINKYKRFLKEK